MVLFNALRSLKTFLNYSKFRLCEFCWVTQCALRNFYISEKCPSFHQKIWNWRKDVVSFVDFNDFLISEYLYLNFVFQRSSYCVLSVSFAFHYSNRANFASTRSAPGTNCFCKAEKAILSEQNSLKYTSVWFHTGL